MKEIKAFIKPGRVQKVVEALKEAGFESVTLSKKKHWSEESSGNNDSSI